VSTTSVIPRASARDQRIETLQHTIELGAKSVDAPRARGDEQPKPDECVAERRDRSDAHGIDHASSRWTSSMDALAPSTRSLLIWMPALYASRRWRSTLYFVSVL